MSSLQSILENLDTPELLCQSVKCILQVARSYPHVFSTNFRVSRLAGFPCFSVWGSSEVIGDIAAQFVFWKYNVYEQPEQQVEYQCPECVCYCIILSLNDEAVSHHSCWQEDCEDAL